MQKLDQILVEVVGNILVSQGILRKTVKPRGNYDKLRRELLQHWENESLKNVNVLLISHVLVGDRVVQGEVKVVELPLVFPYVLQVP